MSKLYSKIVSVATTLTVVAMMVPTSAGALTAAELQTQINDLLATLALLQTQLTQLEGGGSTGGTVPAECVGITFDRALKTGMTGSDVKCLQALLNTDADTKLADSGAGSPGNETTYFGSITNAGVVKFQEKYAADTLAPWGLTSGTGFVGSTTRAKLNEILTAGGGTTPPVTPPVTPPTSGVAMSLASDTPAARAVAKGAYDKIFAKINVSAGDAVTITSISVHRNGVSADTDLAEIKIYDGATQLGSTQALNTVTHKATFSGLSWSIPAGQTKVLTIKGNVATGATAGNQLNIGIKSSSDVVATGGIVVTGAPIYGSYVTIAGTSVGTLDVDANEGPYPLAANMTTGNIVSGTVDQKVGSFKFAASSTEGFDVQEIKVTEIGTSVDSDITNITLKYLGETLGTASVLTGGSAVFTGDPLLSIAAGTNKNIDVYVDVASGVISDRTIQFEISEYGDVTAIGQNTGGVVRISHHNAAGTWEDSYGVEQSSTWHIIQGTLTVAKDGAVDPAATSYVVGSDQNLITALKFSAAATEGVKITKLKLTKTNGGSGTVIDDSEFQNVRLYLDGVDLGYVGSISSAVVTFQNEDGLFEVPRSGNTTVVIKADITTAADNNDKLGFYISAVTQVEMKGLTSGAKIQSTAANINENSIDTPAEATVHTVVGNGNLTLSSSPETPAAQSITVGQNDFELMRFTASAEYEDMRMSAVTVRFYNNITLTAAGVDTAATSTGYISSVKLYEGSPTSGTLIAEVSTPSDGYVNFSPSNLIITRDTTETFSVVVDVPNGSNLQYLSASVGDKTGNGWTSATDLTTTGISSSQDIAETGGALSSVMTLAAPALAVTAASAPPAQNIVTNSSEAWLGRLQLTAANEDVKVTRVRITFDDAARLVAASDAESIFTNVILKVGSTQIGTMKNISNAGGDNSKDIVTFDGINNLTVGEDQTVSLDIYAKATATSTDTSVYTWYVGCASASDIVGSGVYSNTAVNSSGEARASQGATIQSQGTLTVAVDADTSVDKNVAVGTTGATGVEFNKIKFEATYEDIKVTKLKLTLTDPAAGATTTHGSYDIDKVYLYDGSTQLAYGTVVGTTVSFVNEAGLFTVPNAGSKVITVKADLFGTSNGAVSGDAPKFYIVNNQDTAQIQGLGASSNASTSATDGSPNPETVTEFGAVYMYKTNVTVAKNASCPSGNQSPGANQEVFRFDVTADSKGDAVVNTIALTTSGTIDLTGTGNASLYKSTDLNNAIALETGKTWTLTGDIDGGMATTWVTTTDANCQGIPIGSTIHVKDSSVPTYSSAEVTQIWVDADASGACKIIHTALSFTPTSSDIYYYQPLQPSSTGKLFFGAQQELAASTTHTDETITLESTDGFSVGDPIRITGYTAAGAATTSPTLLVGTTTPTVISLATSSVSTGRVNAKIRYDYFIESPTDADVDRAVVYAMNATSTVNETVAAGTTKTFVVKGDTTGGTAAESLGISLNAAADFNWDDKTQRTINTNTLTFPVQTTLNY